MASYLPRSNTTSSDSKSPNTELCTLTLRDSSVPSGVCLAVLPSLGLTDAHSYDAHPMAILTSAFAYLGSYYSEANPSLQGTGLLIPMGCELSIVLGQKLYTKGDAESLAMIDKQIYRLIGKATTLAA